MAKADKLTTPKASKLKPPKAKKVSKDKAAKPPLKKVKVRGKDVTLLSGGNPQIAKGYGEGPVKAYIDAMPGWKSEMGRRLDAIITKTVPNVQKAVKWNSPL